MGQGAHLSTLLRHCKGRFTIGEYWDRATRYPAEGRTVRAAEVEAFLRQRAPRTRRVNVQSGAV